MRTSWQETGRRQRVTGMAPTKGKWLRVSRRNPCPFCAKPDWCLISPDGNAAICARVESERPAGTKGAGWLHRLTDNPRPLLLPPKPKPAAPQAPKAVPDTLDAAYRALPSELVLSPSHRISLLRRGLTDQDIRRLGYKSFPIAGRGAIVERLKAKGITLIGVPGFWLDAGNVRLAGPVGIAIPVRDLLGRIQGIQIRCDCTERGKYKWISSKGFNMGCSPGVPVHVAKPESALDCTETWITEGPLKADIAALKLNRVFLAVAGVGNWAGTIPLIRELAPRRVIVAYDQDKNTNPAVHLHTNQLIENLLRRGIRCFEADWNPTWKGIDDLVKGDNDA